jgi:hypothetical protein
MPTNNDQPPQGNDPIDIKHKNLRMELDAATKDRDKWKTSYDALATVHRKLIADIDSENRSILTQKLKALTNLTEADLQVMETDEMVRLVESYSLLKKPIAGIGSSGEDGPKNRPGQTVPNRFKYGPK